MYHLIIPEAILFRNKNNKRVLSYVLKTGHIGHKVTYQESQTLHHHFVIHRVGLAEVVERYLNSPASADTNHPCFACGQLTWREHPEKVGGGYYCSTCHPNVKSKSNLSTNL